MNKNNRTLISCLALLALAGCGNDSTQFPAEDVEACEHLDEGPSSEVEATAMNGPAIGEGHRRYDVKLIDLNGQKGGTVTFSAVSAGTRVFYLNKDVKLELKSGSGATVALQDTSSGKLACDKLKSRYTAPLEVGSYTLSFGPTSEGAVSIVVEQLGG